MKSLNIKTLDGGDFKVDWEVIQKSQTIKTMIEDLGIDQDSMGEDTIPLSNEEVTSEVFKKVLEWLEHDRGNAIPIEVDNDDEDDLFKNILLLPLNIWMLGNRNTLIFQSQKCFHF